MVEVFSDSLYILIDEYLEKEPIHLSNLEAKLCMKYNFSAAPKEEIVPLLHRWVEYHQTPCSITSTPKTEYALGHILGLGDYINEKIDFIRLSVILNDRVYPIKNPEDEVRAYLYIKSYRRPET